MKKPTTCSHPEVVQSGTETTIETFCRVCGELLGVDRVGKKTKLKKI